MPDPLMVRTATTADLDAVAAIQAAAPEAAQWNPADYLDHGFLIAVREKTVAGFLVFRQSAPDEREILNLAVSPEFRRQNVGRSLFAAGNKGFSGSVFLEVRESNVAAQEFYKSLGFKVISRR